MAASETTASEKTGAVVVSLRPGYAIVRVTGHPACARCRSGRGCGAAVFAGARAREVEVVTPPGVSLAVGQPVELALGTERVLHAAWLAYGLPLSALFATAVAAGYLMPGSGSDAPAVVLAVAALLAAGWWARRRLRRDGCSARFVPALESPADSRGRTG